MSASRPPQEVTSVQVKNEESSANEGVAETAGSSATAIAATAPNTNCLRISPP